MASFIESLTDEQLKVVVNATVKGKNGNTADAREEIIEAMFNTPYFGNRNSRTAPLRQELHQAVREEFLPSVLGFLANYTGDHQKVEIRKTPKTKQYDFDIFLDGELQPEKLEHKLIKPKRGSKGVYYDVPQMMNFQLNKKLFDDIFLTRNHRTYADFVWERYLPEVAKLYGVSEELPTRRAYNARCGQIVAYDKEKCPFIKEIRTIHRNKRDQSIDNLAALNRLSRESFVNYYKEELDLDVDALLRCFKEANANKLVVAQYDQVKFKTERCEDVFGLDELKFTEWRMEEPRPNTRNAHHATLYVQTNQSFELQLTFRWMNGLWQHNPAVKLSVVALK